VEAATRKKGRGLPRLRSPTGDTSATRTAASLATSRTVRLPAVSWVIPSLKDSDHPASGCSGGPRWVSSVLNAIGQSKYWNSTVVIVLWDDWGGWYDPVPPPQTNYTSLGFRVGTIVISPWARPNTVVHTQYEFRKHFEVHRAELWFGLASYNRRNRDLNRRHVQLLAEAYEVRAGGATTAEGNLRERKWRDRATNNRKRRRRTRVKSVSK